MSLSCGSELMLGSLNLELLVCLCKVSVYKSIRNIAIFFVVITSVSSYCIPVLFLYSFSSCYCLLDY